MPPQVEQPVSARRYFLQSLLGREGSKKLVRPIDLRFPSFSPRANKSLRFPWFLLLSTIAIFSRKHNAPGSRDLIRAVAVQSSLSAGMKAPVTPSESFSKQARAILYIGPGHFDSIQSFFKQLDISILGNQPREEELMNSSSRFA